MILNIGCCRSYIKLLLNQRKTKGFEGSSGSCVPLKLLITLFPGGGELQLGAVPLLSIAKVTADILRHIVLTLPSGSLCDAGQIASVYCLLPTMEHFFLFFSPVKKSGKFKDGKIMVTPSDRSKINTLKEYNFPTVVSPKVTLTIEAPLM